MKAHITLKSGATVTADVEELTIRRHRLTNELTGIEWTHIPRHAVEGEPPITKRLNYIIISEIAAVVTEARFRLIEED
jgi:hypothetical protein